MASNKVVTLTAANWGQEVLESSIPVLVDIWAPWCGPCLRLAPVIEELAVEYDGGVKVGKLNADEHASIVSQYGVMSLPTLLVFRAGQPVQSSIGLKPKRDVQRFVDEAIR